MIRPAGSKFGVRALGNSYASECASNLRGRHSVLFSEFIV
jgi:hypothetical protein